MREFAGWMAVFTGFIALTHIRASKLVFAGLALTSGLLASAVVTGVI